MKLSDAEREFLRHLLATHREYYGILASHPRCTPANRERFHFINALYQKLSPYDNTSTRTTVSKN
jgi:hypothetical protein